jgi:hypothetical protein
METRPICRRQPSLKLGEDQEPAIQPRRKAGKSCSSIRRNPSRTWQCIHMACARELMTFDINKDLLQQFKGCWMECPALNLLLIPDWAAFEDADRFLMETGSTHRSMPLLAFERG